MSELDNLHNGSGYVSSKAAADALGVTNDYIARLCRQGKIRGVLEGRIWFVDTASLSIFFGRNISGSIEAPIKIYYKDTPTIVPEIRPGQVADNEAVLSICPPEAQGHIGAWIMPRRTLIRVVRTTIFTALLFWTAMLGTGSYMNNAPAYASAYASNQFAAAGSSAGGFSGITGTARAVASTVDTVMYNLLYSHPENAAPVVIVHNDRSKSAPLNTSTTSTYAAVRAQQPITQTIINNPVIERTIEKQRVVSEGGISETYLNQHLDALEGRLRSLVFASPGSQSSGNTALYNVIAQTNRIDSLGNVDITGSRIVNSTITNSMLVNATLSGTTSLNTVAIGGATTTASSGFDISSGCFSVNGVCITNSGSGTPAGPSGSVQFNDGGTLNGTSTLSFSTSSNRLLITNASTTNLTIAGSVTGAGLTSCSGSLDKIQYNSTTGQFLCAADQTGGGSGSDVNWSFFNGSALRPSTTTNQVLIGGIATTTNAKLQVIGGAQIDNATSTSINTNMLGIGGSSYFVSLTGNGLQNNGGTLTVNQGQAFSTTSIQYWDSTQARWATTSTDYWKTQNDFFSTTSASAFLALNQGNAFSSTSAAYYASQNNAFSTTSTDYWKTQNNFHSTSSFAYNLSTYSNGSFFSTTSVAYWDSTQFRWATTSSDAWLATKDKGYFFSTTSASNFLAQNTGAAFSTTSALFFSSVGLAHATTSVAYQLTQNPVFTNGFTAFASSTIGNGTQTSGLTINGGATTTGNAYFGGRIGVGTTSPYAKLSISANSGETNTTLFAIASSTSNSTSTLFSVDNTGSANIFNLKAASTRLASRGLLFFDDFNRPNTSAGSLGNAPEGQGAYDLRGVGANTTLSTTNIQNGRWVSAPGDIAYAVQTAPQNITRMGGSVSWTSGNGGSEEGTFAMIISPNNTGTQLITNAIHVILYPSGWAIQVIDNGSFNTIKSGSFSPALASTTGATSYPFEIRLNGPVLYYSFAGVTGSASDPRFQTFDGRYATWEHYYNSASVASLLRIESVWMGTSDIDTGPLYAMSTSGNVGIGTTTPDARLTIGSPSAYDGSLLKFFSSTEPSNYNLSLKSTATAGLVQYGFDTINAGTSYLHNLVLDRGNVGIGTTTPLSTLTVSGGTSIGADYNVAAPTNGMIVEGNVGIGTNSPTSPYKLDVRGQIATQGSGINSSVVLNNTGSNGRAYGIFSSDDTLPSLLGASSLAFYDGIAGIARLVINANGNIGIGTTTAGTTLSIQGVANFASATSTFTAIGGINLSAGCFAINGACLTSGSGSSFSTTSALFFSSVGLAHSTTSVAYQLSQTPVFTNGFIAQASSTFNSLINIGAITSTSTLLTFAGQSFIVASTTGSNTAVGLNALSATTTGSGNSAFGFSALQFNTLGTSNTAIGLNTLRTNTTGLQNVAVGSTALFNNTTGSSNVAIGYQALSNNVSATSSVAVGWQAGVGGISYSNQGGVYVGLNAGLSASNGSDYNTFVGYQAGRTVTTGGRNVIIGPTTVVGNLSSGWGNIGIGDEIFFPSATANKQLNIGGLILGTLPATSTSGFVVPTSGTIGIGTTSPTSKFGIAANNGDTLTTLFQISSSTNNTTSTLFAIDNTGRVSIGNVSPVSASAQLSVLSGTSTITRLSQANTAAGNSFSSDAIRAQGRYVYLAEGGSPNKLQIFDVSTSSPSLLSSNNLNNGAGFNNGMGMYVLGNYAYITEGITTSNAFEIWNISNPSVPFRVSQTNLANGASSGDSIDGIYVQGRYAYIVESQGTTNAFEIFDISNPTAPIRVSQSNLANGGASIVVQGTYAYIAENGTTNGFQIFDISNPITPILVGQLNVNFSTVDTMGLAVQGDLAYLAETGTTNAFQIINISNPAAPALLGQANITDINNGSGNAISVQGRYAYIAEGGGTSNAFEVFDISNPTSIRRVAQANLANGGFNVGHGMTVQGRYAYIAEGGATSNAFEVFDIGGAYIQQLETGGIETGSLAVRNNIQATDASLWGSLNIGASLNVGGGATFTYASTTLFGATTSIFSIIHPNSNGTIFTSLANGNVGIGTTSPTANLSVFNNYGSTNSTLFSIASSTNTTGSTNSSFLSVSATGYGTTTLAGLNVSGSATSTSNVGMNITTGCYAISGICAGGSGTVNSGLLGQVAFYNSNSTAVSATSSLFVATSGNIGIGTTSPETRLTINTAAAGFNSAYNFDYSGGSPLLKNTITTTGASQSRRDLSSLLFGVGSSDISNFQGYMAFSTTPSAGSLTERIRISAEGNVGIGTTTPQVPLTVTKSGAAYSGSPLDGNEIAQFGKTSAGYITLRDDGGRTGIWGTNQGPISIGSYSNDNFALLTNNVIRATLDTNGDFGIGTSAFPYGERLGISFPNTQGVHLDESTGSNSVNYIYLTKQGVNVGAAYYDGATVAWQTTSDKRIKENIVPTTGGLDTLLKIPVYNFNYKSNPGHTVEGFVAQDLYPYFPQIVHATDDGVSALATSSEPWSIDYSGITPLLVKSIQDLNVKIDYRTGGLVSATSTDIAPLSATTTAFELTNATTTLATTTPWIASFATSSVSLRAEIGSLLDTVIHVLGRAVYATTGVFEKIFAKEVHTDKLCVSDDSGETCVTKTQLDSLLAGAAASQQSAPPSAPSVPPADPNISSGDASTSPDQTPPPVTDPVTPPLEPAPTPPPPDPVPTP